jgi:hypothetical protein
MERETGSRRAPAAALLLAGIACLMGGAAAWSQQADFAGEWTPLFHEDGPERIPGPELGDYSGFPINAEARLRADSYDGSRISVVTEYTCRQHGGDYSMRGLSNMRVQTEYDPVTQKAVAIHTRMGFQNMERTIWLDGRAHPSAYAAHTWQGFSTAKFEGEMLAVYSTHLKQSYMRRNGLPSSADRTFTEFWTRHGNYLTVVTVVEDPVFLTERLVRSQTWALDPGQRMGNNPCEYVPEDPAPQGTVPAYLPGTNPYLREFAERYGLPQSGVRGGADTIYPEFRLHMEKPASNPPHCTFFCTCMNTGNSCPEIPPKPPAASPAAAAPAAARPGSKQP